jgi:hypothetical protein
MEPEEKSLHSEGPADPLQSPRRAISEAELREWEREDREDVESLAAIENRLAAQASRTSALETSWRELADRVRVHAQRAADLEAELESLRQKTKSAQASRRSAAAELRRAERRAETLQTEVEGLQTERERDVSVFEDQLTKVRGVSARHERALSELEQVLDSKKAAERTAASEAEQLRARLAEAEQERERLVANALATEEERARLHEVAHEAEGEQRRLESKLQELERRSAADGEAAAREIQGAREESERLRASVDAAAEAGRRAEAEAERLLVERRALVADLIGTQNTLQARSEQLQRIYESRWQRFARAAWSLRRRRPPAISTLLLAAAVGVVAAAILVGSPGVWQIVSGVLAGVLLAVGAAVSAVAIPGLRDQRVPRMAGDGSFARSLDVGEEEQVELPPKRVERPNATEPIAEVRVVPRPVADDDAERLAWVNGGGANLSQLRVAAILDEMSAASFGPECRLDVGFHATNWRERLESAPPHMLLVESAWAGNGGGWQYCVGTYTHSRYAGLPFLRELTSWCHENGIPTVFWNKEDPVHFDRFKEAAGLFDHVFTTDANRIPAYERLPDGRARSVSALPFAAQPRLHNPIPLVESRSRNPVFAGTYYRDRHPDRQRDLEAILDAARPHGLIIYDRTLGSESESYGFPERFLPHIEGKLSYRETLDAYKSHTVFLNVNSVTDSPTMFSRRVFELLACGTAVLSTPSVGMEELFGDLVPVARTEEEASHELASLLEDDERRRTIALRGQQLVLGSHTYRDRLQTMAEEAGFEVSKDGEDVAALALVEDRTGLDSLLTELERQRRPVDETLVGVAGDSSFTAEVRDRLANLQGGASKVIAQSATDSNSARLRELAALATSHWVAPLSPGSPQLDVLLTCARFSEAQVIGFAGGASRANAYDGPVSPRLAIAERDLAAHRGWPADESEMRRWLAQGVRIYAAEPRLGD